MSSDPWSVLAASRARELHAEAQAWRTRPRHRPCPAVPRYRRWYARLWWAVRPRAAAWTPGLFDA